MNWSDAWERLRAIDPGGLVEIVRAMSLNEAIAFGIFLIFTIAFFLWVAYLAIRR